MQVEFEYEFSFVIKPSGMSKKIINMKTFIYLFTLFLPITLSGQDVYKLSLENVHPPELSVKFKVIKIIDGRKRKDNIGWVQTGAFNRKKIADFNATLVEQIESFLENSITYLNDTPIVVRINHLYISEQTKAMSETGKAEVFMDYFLQADNNKYHYITSTSTVKEHTGADVTNHHSKNIGAAIIEGLKQFSERSWEEI